MERPTILVVYPYKFTENYYRKFEIEALLERNVNVVVWDTGYWVHRRFMRALSAASSERSCVTHIGSLTDLLRAARRPELKKRAEVVAFPVSRPSNLRELICLLVIKWRAGTRVEFLNGGIPLAATEPQRRRTTAFRKLATLVRVLRERGLAGAAQLAEKSVTRILSAWLSVRPTHRLMGGRSLEELYRKDSESNGIAVVSGSAWDLSNSLAFPGGEAPKEIGGRYAVLLDGAGPAGASDVELRGDEQVLTTERWYPALVERFDQWERELGIRIVVAGHPKGALGEHPAAFGGRRVYYGRTEELVKHSEFVITRFSAAVSYAVIYNKPIVCIYNEQMRADATTFRYLQEATRTLGVTPINVDDPPSSIAQYLSVNKDLYRRYTADYLTTFVDPKPNYRVILEDIMGQGSSESDRWRE